MISILNGILRRDVKYNNDSQLNITRRYGVINFKIISYQILQAPMYQNQMVLIMKKYFLTSQSDCLLSLFANRFLKISFETLAQRESKYLDVLNEKKVL